MKLNTLEIEAICQQLREEALQKGKGTEREAGRKEGLRRAIEVINDHVNNKREANNETRI